MRSPEIEPARLERLLAGFAPETAQEAILQGLVRELRGGMAEAPLVLRERVRMIVEPQARTRVLTRRRLVAVVAVGVLVAAVGAFAFVDRGSAPSGDADTAAAPREMEAAGSADIAPPSAVVPLQDIPTEEHSSALQSDELRATAVPKASTFAPATDAARAQDVKMSVGLRVPGTEALSQAVNDAMALTKELGGHVSASAVDTEGESGTAQLALRIPVGKVEDAVVGLSALGTITSQNVRTIDLQDDLDVRARRMERLRRSVAADELRLASGTLTPEQKLTVELRLAESRADLRALRRERARIAWQASNAELAVTLRTGSSPAAKEKDEGAFMGAVHNGFDFLAAAGAVALLVLIAASPLIVLVVLAWLLLRTRRRRIDEKLLADPHPAGPPRAAE